MVQEWVVFAKALDLQQKTQCQGLLPKLWVLHSKPVLPDWTSGLGLAARRGVHSHFLASNR
jgi:hypothetical protein